jgi:hypothetical protein
VTPFHGVRLRRPAGPQMMVFAGSDRGGERAAPAEYLQELVADHKSSTRVFAGSEESVAIISPCASTNCCCRATTISHFGGSAAPAAMFFYSKDRAGKHPERLRRRLRGIQHSLQAGATVGSDHEAAYWVHARRKLFELADVTAKAARQDIGAERADRLRGRPEDRSVFTVERSITWGIARGTPCRAAHRMRRSSMIGSIGCDASEPSCRARTMSPSPPGVDPALPGVIPASGGASSNRSLPVKPGDDTPRRSGARHGLTGQTRKAPARCAAP